MAEDNFHCKVCFEDYNENERKPKILGNCGHTFCLECVSGFFKSSPSPECPFCRKRVGMFLSELKDNYELMELLPSKVDKSPKFFCEVCDKVAARHCMDHHSIRSFASIAAEKIKKSRENLVKKIHEEKSLLKEVHSALKVSLQAVERTVVARLECELDLCKKRMEHLDHLPQDFEVAQSTVSRNGDLHLLSVFDFFDNKDECVFLHKALEVHAEAAKCQLTLHSTDKEVSFSLGQSDEDQALAYLISILSDNQMQSTKGTVAKTNWLPSPWVTKWGKNPSDVHSIRNDVASSRDPFSDDESVTSEVTEPEVSREIYVGGIKNQDATYDVLKAIFSPHGKIMNIVIIPAGPKIRASIAFIEFEDERTALNVLNKKDLFNRKHGLQVKPRNEKKRNRKRPQKGKNSIVFQNSQQTQILSDSLGEQQELAERMLFIQNVPVDFPEHRISELLSKYGPVQDVRKQRKLDGQVARAFAFVTFVHKYSAQNALKETVKRIFCGSGIVLEYRAYRPRPNDSSETRSAENSTSRPNSTSSAINPLMCTSSTVTKSTSSPSTTAQAGVATNSSTRPTTSTNFVSPVMRPLMSITTPAVTGPQTSTNSSSTMTQALPPLPVPLPAKTVIRPPTSASSAAARPTPPSNTSSILIRPVLSVSSSSTTSRQTTSFNSTATSRPVTSQPRYGSSSYSNTFTPSAPPIPHARNEKECIIQ